MIRESPMAGRVALDEEFFSRLLAAAFVMQEHRDRVRAKMPAHDFNEIVSQIVETQHLIQSRKLELNAALDLIATRLQKLSGAEGAAIGLLEGESLTCKAACGSAASLAGLQVRAQASLSAQCLKTGENLRSPLAETDRRLDPVLRLKVGARSLIAAPVYHEGKIGGAVELYFSEVSAFGESDVRSCELMAGLVSEVIAQAAEQSARQELAAERASVLLALEKLKPQLQRLAAEPPPAQEKPEKPAAPKAEAELCRACGHAFAGNETCCGVCGASRATGRYPGAELQSKWAALWEQQAKDGGGLERPPMFRRPPPEENVPLEVEGTELSNIVPFLSSAALEELEQRQPRPGEDAVLAETQPVVESPAGFTEAIEPDLPWTSALRAREWLKAQVEGRAWSQRLKSVGWMHWGDLSLGLAALVLLTALVWGLWPQRANPVSANDQAPAGAHAIRRHPRPKPPQLTLFERALVSLGLAEPPPTPAYMGNPNVKVWVDLQTALYYCPGTDLYGTTPKGKYTSQGDAQQDSFEPAYRKPCE